MKVREGVDTYNQYNCTDYPEIENKMNRPYMVMLIMIENNTFAINLTCSTSLNI